LLVQCIGAMQGMPKKGGRRANTTLLLVTAAEGALGKGGALDMMGIRFFWCDSFFLRWEEEFGGQKIRKRAKK
jgi:hypothetical protein